MKKSLVLLPFAAFLLTGCLALPGAGGDSSSSSSTSSSSSSSTRPTITPTTPTVTPAEDLPTSHGASFDLTPGEHVFTINFVTDYEKYAGSGNGVFPYVANDTGLSGGMLEGMAIMSNGCYCANYQGSGYVMMKNKDRSAKGCAFIGNCVSLGAVTKVEFTAGASASTAQKYDITFSSTLEKTASTSGTEVAHPGGSATCAASEGKGFFRLSTKDITKNGQLGTLSVTYVIS